MGSSRLIHGLLVASAGWAVFQMPLPVQAAVFDFTSAVSTNSSIKTLLDSGMTLTTSNSNSTGTNPNTVNTNPMGLCAWTKVGTTNGGLGRCGYGTGNPNAGISSFEFKFDKPVVLNSLEISQFDAPNIGLGTIGFSTDNINFTNLSFNSTGVKPFSFKAMANQPIFVRTSAEFGPNSDTGIFRIGRLNTTEVPGPLPILGVGAAFSMSRKLRQLSSVNKKYAGVS